jgi:PAS domain S-box-containing protein
MPAAMKSFFSLRRRLLTALIGLATVPLLLAGSVLGWRAYQHGVDEAFAHKQDMARQVAVQTEAYMRNFQSILESSVRVSDFAVADPQARRQTLSRILATRSLYREVAFIDAAGKQSLHLSNIRLLARDHPPPPAFHAAFRAAASSGEVVYGPIYLDPDNNEPLLLLALPVRDFRSGRLAGAIVAEVRCKPIWHLVAGLELAKGEDVYILDAEGRVIAHRNPSIVLRETRFAARPEQRRQPGLDGEDAFVAVHSFELGQRTFRVVAEHEVRNVLQPAINGILISGVVILITLLGVFAIGVPLSRRISQPIIAVAQTARAIRDGDLQRRVGVDSNDEIGELARSFNSMTERLRDTVMALEAEVRERRRAQLDLERLNRAYRALSLSNQAVARAVDEATLLDEASRIVQQDCGYRQVRIDLIEPDAPQTSAPVDVAQATLAALPIQSGDQVYGVLLIDTEQSDAMTEDETRLLAELAENIGFGIAKLRALEQRQAAKADLARSKELFQTVTQFATDWSYWRSEDQRTFHYISPICEAITGYSAAEFEADPELLERVIHPDDRSRWETHLDEHGGDTQHAPQEYRILTKSGELRWISHTCRPVLLEDGSRMGLRGANQDISARKQSEAELARYRQQLEELVAQRGSELRRQRSFVEAVLENLADGIIACDEHGKLSLFNPASREIHGIDMEQLPAEQWAERYQLFHEDGVTPMRTQDIPLYRAYQGEIIKNQEMVIEHRDGRKLTIVASGQAMYDDQGDKIGAVVTMHDISEQKRVGIELQRAKEAAEAANRAKSAFLANMSHELRTPLNAILGFAQIMTRDTSLAAEHRRELATIERAGQHLLSLINDVLDISRIEAGRISLRSEVFSLAETLTGIEEMLRVRATAKGLALRFECHGELHPYLLGDAPHLRQVLINLLGNAVKYTDRGAVSLHLYPVDGHIRFEVRDTGPGIAAEEQTRIFQAFYQTEVGVNKGEGTGLGLTISREFVHLMGGELAVESSPGHGSTFSFTIPLAAAGAPEAHTQPGRVIGIEPGQQNWRILVAEDHPDSRDLICRLLEGVGLQVRAVDNGAEAVSVFQSWRPHFIWMDMRMPVLDGYQATRRIRALPGGGEVRIAALTASAFQEDRDTILASGCDEMLRKPIEENRLFGVMSDLLGLRFTYADNAEIHATPPREVDISHLPSATRAELGRAAAMLDIAAARAIADSQRAEHPAEAEAIDELIEAYRFDRLIELCDEPHDSPPALGENQPA